FTIATRSFGEKMHKSKPLYIAVAIAAVTISSRLATAADVYLYEPFNYPDSTLLEGQSPDGIRTWNVAGSGAGDASTGRPHAATGNLSMPAAMPAASGNQAVYGGIGAGTRITLSSDLL